MTRTLTDEDGNEDQSRPRGNAYTTLIHARRIGQSSTGAAMRSRSPFSRKEISNDQIDDAGNQRARLWVSGDDCFLSW